MSEAPVGARFCPNCGSAVSAGRFCASCGYDLATGQAQAATAPPAPSEARRAIEWAGVVILIAGCLAALGSFLPWITATAGFVGTISRNGFDGGGDGIITIALGIIIALLGIALLSQSGNPRTARIGALICAIVLGWIAVTDINSVNERLRSIDSTLETASVGTGIIVIAFAAVLTVIGTFMPGQTGNATRISGLRILVGGALLVVVILGVILNLVRP